MMYRAEITVDGEAGMTETEQLTICDLIDEMMIDCRDQIRRSFPALVVEVEL